MTNHFGLLGTVFATAVLTSSAVGAGGIACDPMYPCVADATTPAAVYDLTARTAAGPGGELVADLRDYRGAASPAAVSDLTARAAAAPCESYPCYLDAATPASPLAADATLILRPVGQRG